MFELENLLILPRRLETSAQAFVQNWTGVMQLSGTDAGNGFGAGQGAESSNYADVEVTNSASAYDNHDTYVDISFES